LKPSSFTSEDSEEEEEIEDLGEVFVHQIIEVIEFVLGGISHTASYLRLWALSLAHSQLAEVFFTRTLGYGITLHFAPLIVVGYAGFAAATFGILLCMDLMECLLHALRLHW